VRSETIVRLRAVGIDWSAPNELELRTLAPAEPWSEGNPVGDSASSARYLSGWKLYLPEAADLTARDRVEVRGGQYSVFGDPAPWLGGGTVVIVADLWTADCSIRHPGGTRGAFDSTTGTYPTVPFDPYYVGGCRIQVLSTEEQRELVAEEQITSVGYLIVVDLDESLESRAGDLVTITAVDDNGDPQLIGQTVQVRSLARGAQPWERDLRCTFPLPKV
jgi:hypothetical protein